MADINGTEIDLGRMPIVGQERTHVIHDVRTTVVVTCTCGKDGAQPMLIDNLHQVGTCRGCGADFTITHLHAQRNGRELGVQVGVGRLEKSTIRKPSQGDVARMGLVKS